MNRPTTWAGPTRYRPFSHAHLAHNDPIPTCGSAELSFSDAADSVHQAIPRVGRARLEFRQP